MGVQIVQYARELGQALRRLGYPQKRIDRMSIADRERELTFWMDVIEGVAYA